MQKNDWVVDNRGGHVFQIREVWGDWLLWDNCLDTGDVSFKADCRMATNEEIQKELQRRKDILERPVTKQIV